jgi:hypothetical protein
MVEMHFKTFLPLAAASSGVVITAQSAPIGVVRLQGVRRGAAIRRALSLQRSTCHSSPQAAGSAGEWPATTAAPAKAGALTRLLSVCAHRFRVVHRLLSLAGRRRRPLPSAPPSPHDAGVYSGSSPKPVIADQRGRRFAETPYNNSLTSDFSSFSSATDASIFARLKSFIGSRCTISHFPSRTRTGNDEINPCSTS